MYNKYLVLNNLQWLICYKTQPNKKAQIPSLTLSINPHRSSLLISPLDGIQSPHKADEYKF